MARYKFPLVGELSPKLLPTKKGVPEEPILPIKHIEGKPETKYSLFTISEDFQLILPPSPSGVAHHLVCCP
jgi:hypothetical protein